MKTQKVKFATRFNRPDTIAAPMGNGERSLFAVDVDENGVPCLKVVGKENFKDFIEASKSETLISNIIDRFNKGDLSVLQRVQGFFGDVTGMPDNLADAKKFLIQLENKFNALSDDVKKKFDNSFNKFVENVSSFSVDEFSSTFGLIQPQVDNSNTDKKEVTADE